jgi:predicted dehydrogenase
VNPSGLIHNLSFICIIIDLSIMVPHAKSPIIDEAVERLPAPEQPPMSDKPPRFMIIGAGSRGNSYARFIGEATNGICTGVVEPIAHKRQRLGSRFIWGKTTPTDGQEFEDWKDFLSWELDRRGKASRGEIVPEGVDGVFICVQDNLHREVIIGLAPLGIHIMCEKPLATSLDDCVSIYKTLLSGNTDLNPSKLFSIGHVLRYSPHNMLLRKLLLEEKAIGDIVSISHTEPVGWWHFSHSYVRYANLHGLKIITNVSSEEIGARNQHPRRHYLLSLVMILI